MTTKITEFYIGLSGKDMENQELEASEVKHSISEMVSGGTFKASQGLWMGDFENSIVFEVADLDGALTEEFEEAYKDSDKPFFELVKERLENEFNQDSVMVKRYQADIIF